MVTGREDLAITSEQAAKDKPLVDVVSTERRREPSGKMFLSHLAIYRMNENRRMNTKAELSK